MPAADRSLSVLIASPEIVPYAKTGGLGDVIGSLPGPLAKLGAQVSLVMPAYRCVPEGFHNLRDAGRVATAADFQHQPVHAIAGIGHPQRFFEHLRQLGLTPQTHPFPDHYHYNAADLEFGDDSAILMTEKDAVKCLAFAKDNYWALRVDAQLDPALTQLILKKIAR